MNNLYEEITNQIISLLEQGEIPWHKPWAGVVNGGPIKHVSGEPYSFLNQMLLQKPGEYLSFNQCKKEGGHVKKGAKAKTVYFWKSITRPELDENGQPVLKPDGTVKLKMIPVLKQYKVFHLDDCEGVKAKWADKLPETPAEPIEAAEETLQAYVQREKIHLVADQISNRAYYSPAFDLINLPCLSQYKSAAEYYSTAFHEATHSTGHPSRLNRFGAAGKSAAFGSEEYSKEELTAEIGAACILHHLGIGTPDSLKNSAGYIQGWLRALKDDKQMIVGASSRAEKAARMILNLPDPIRTEMAEG